MLFIELLICYSFPSVRNEATPNVYCCTVMQSRCAELYYGTELDTERGSLLENGPRAAAQCSQAHLQTLPESTHGDVPHYQLPRKLEELQDCSTGPNGAEML